MSYPTSVSDECEVFAEQRRSRLRGNAHTSRTRIRQALEDIAVMWQSAEQHLHRVHEPGEYFLNGTIPEALVDKVVQHNDHANDMTGHRFRSYRHKRDFRENARGGKGFSYKPEIPYRVAGQGTVHLNGAAVTSNGVEEQYDDLDEAFFRQKYARKNHPDQSMPKVEWAVERDWRNNYRNYESYVYLHKVGLKAATAKVREEDRRNHLALFRGRTGY